MGMAESEKTKAGKPGGVWSDDTIKVLTVGGSNIASGCPGTRMQSSLCMKYFQVGGSHGRQGR